MLNFNKTREILIRKFKEDPNEQNDNGETPLLQSPSKQYFPIIAKLPANGARPNIANKFGETSLHWVIAVRDEEAAIDSHLFPRIQEPAIRIIVYNSGDVAAKGQAFSTAGEFFTRLKSVAGTTLHRAVSRRNPATDKYLLKTGCVLSPRTRCPTNGR